MPVEVTPVKGHVFKIWAKADSNGTIPIMRQLDSQPASEFNLARDVPASQKVDPAVRQRIEAGLQKIKTDGAAEFQADKRAKAATPAVPGTKSTGNKVSPEVQALTAALRLVAADLKIEMQALVDAKADCFFGQGCFAAGTKLWTPEGYRPIETIRAGETVWSRDEWNPSAPVEAKVVEAVFERHSGVYHLHVGNQVLRASGEHPFYVAGAGWTAVKELKGGELLLTADGTWVVASELYDTGEWELVRADRSPAAKNSDACRRAMTDVMPEWKSFQDLSFDQTERFRPFLPKRTEFHAADGTDWTVDAFADHVAGAIGKNWCRSQTIARRRGVPVGQPA